VHHAGSASMRTGEEEAGAKGSAYDSSNHVYRWHQERATAFMILMFSASRACAENAGNAAVAAGAVSQQWQAAGVHR